VPETQQAKAFSVSLLIPAFNEEQTLSPVLEDTFRFLSSRPFDWEVLALDDHSSDATPQVLQDLKNKYPELQYFTTPQNRGVGSALTALMEKARKEYCFFIPADGQVKAGELDKFLPFLQEADLLVGYRKHRADPQVRKFFSGVFNRLFSRIFKLKIHDADSVFLVKKSLWRELAPRFTGAMLLGEMLVKSSKAGYTVKEVEISHYPRAAGAAKGLSWKMISGALGEFYQLYREHNGNKQRKEP